MILVIGFNPCIDVTIEVDSLTVGMSHEVVSRRTFFTGKALNVAVGLSQLGVNAFETGFMYEDNGRLFEQELHKERVNYKFVWGEGRVRENYKFIDRKSMMTEIVDSSPAVSREKQQELISTVAELSKNCEAVIVVGESARGIGSDYFRKILSVVPEGVKKVVDCDGERLLSALTCGLDLVKPNREELENTLGIKIKNTHDALQGCKTLIEKGAKIVLLSLGKEGAIITDGKKSYRCKSINVAMNTTAGAGDAMVAAATKAVVGAEDLQEILKCGVAAGTAAVTLPDRISFRREKYEEILSSLTVEEI